ncbi:MAG: hypothetical protein ACHQAY_12840 [Hyphomicrobiales bacterium]
MRIVHRRFKELDKDGKPTGKELFERYSLDEIDANDAVAKYPEEYSFDAWPQSKPEQIVDKVPPPLEIKPELLPDQAMAAIQAAIVGPRGVPEGFDLRRFTRPS